MLISQVHLYTHQLPLSYPPPHPPEGLAHSDETNPWWALPLPTFATLMEGLPANESTTIPISMCDYANSLPSYFLQLYPSGPSSLPFSSLVFFLPCFSCSLLCLAACFFSRSNRLVNHVSGPEENPLFQFPPQQLHDNSF